MNTPASAAPRVRRSIVDRVGLVLARAVQATFFGSAPIIIVEWILLALIAIPIILFLCFALISLVTMGITGRWELELIGIMFLAILVRALPVLALFAALLWVNDRILYSFNARLPRDPRVRHGR